MSIVRKVYMKVDSTTLAALACLLVWGCITLKPKDAFATYSTDSIVVDFSKKLDPKKVCSDIMTWKHALEEAQTSLYTYASKEKIERAFAQALRKAEEPVSYLDVIKTIARIQHIIACGHSSWEHAAGYRKYRDSNVRMFPMDIAIVNGRYYVKANYSLQAEIPEFTEITHINGRPVKKITSELLPYLYQDGYANRGNTLELEQNFKFAYSNFIDNPEVFTLRTEGKKKYTVKPLLLSQIDSVKISRYEKEERGKPLKFAFIDSSNTGLYTIMRFSNEVIQRNGQEFVSFTDSVFALLREQETTKLIIDLRGNRGGWTGNGVHLLSYFIGKPVPYIKRVETKKYSGYSFASLITENAGYDDTMQLVHNGRYYEWKNNPNLMAYPSGKNRFNGTVYILVDGFTRSASSVFCALMKEHTGALIVGEELTAAHCGTSAMIMHIRLPYTGINISLSTARYSFAISDSSDVRGIMPDIHISPELDQVKGVRDTYMEAVFNIQRRKELIRK